MRKRLLYICLCAVLLCTLLPAGASAFSDVTEGSWYAAAVQEMTAAGLLKGYQDGTFRPNQTISAAEFVTITARSAHLTPVTGQCSHWAAGYMEAALRTGWYDWDECPPTGERFDQPIPRQIAVKILMKAFLPDARGDYTTESRKIADFSDLDGRYYEAVFAAYASGIVKGDASGTFRPKSGLSRAEACILIQRASRKAPSGTGQTNNTGNTNNNTANSTDETPPPAPVAAIQGGVSQNGWLQVIGTQLCSEDGQPVVLRGMSSHGLHWFPQYTNAQSIQNTAAYGANVYRVAMYTGEGGYLSQPAAVKAQAIAAIDAAIQQDMYVILDWHILSDGNPMSHIEEAISFFTEMARRYKDSPALLYEICNEPNGGVSWSGDVKPYAQRLTDTIRAQSPKAVILIGSPTWSQDIHLAAADPVKGDNLMYTLHFYAGTHGADLRQRIDSALSAGIGVFVSEWGTSRADGSGGVFIEESRVWLDFLDQRGISWCNWSLCDKNETSAALRPNTPASRPWTDADFSASGQFVFSRFKGA